jgi:hypothetical protein
MDGHEHPTSNAPHEVYRLSWLAYIGVFFKFLVLIALSKGLSWWMLNKAQTDQAHQIGMVVSVFVLLVALAIFVYKILWLKSVHLYTDNVGVWLYRGVLPWSRGYRCVKWRDIEGAEYFTGFFSWIFRSYSVRIGHRFTKTSAIIVTHLARGNMAVQQINKLHQDMLTTGPFDNVLPPA